VLCLSARSRGRGQLVSQPTCPGNLNLGGYISPKKCSAHTPPPHSIIARASRQRATRRWVLPDLSTTKETKKKKDAHIRPKGCHRGASCRGKGHEDKWPARRTYVITYIPLLLPAGRAAAGNVVVGVIGGVFFRLLPGRYEKQI
jgi:hypothetical protein